MNHLGTKKLVLLVGAFFLFSFLCTSAAFAKKVVIGFVQITPEGIWRTANTESVQNAAKEAGYELILKIGSMNYSSASAKDTLQTQILGMKEFIAKRVDVIAFTPSQIDGWEDVLKEAKAAGIPVINIDRAVNISDRSLLVTHLGSDMIEEGRRAGRWLVNYLKKTGAMDKKIRIVQLEGVKGSTPAIHRAQGFAEIIKDYPNLQIVQSKPADLTHSTGQEVMTEFLNTENGNIDVVFSHNDEMALGAIEAIKKYGKKPGKDIIIIGVDAVKKALEAIVAGEMNATIECNPLLGPQLMAAVKDLQAGKEIPKRIVTKEEDFDQTNAAQALPSRMY